MTYSSREITGKEQELQDRIDELEAENASLRLMLQPTTAGPVEEDVLGTDTPEEVGEDMA
jgi:hypothetical protein